MVELAKNCRIPYRELSDKLGISINAIHVRIKELLKKGIIYRLKAELSWSLFGTTRVLIAGTPSLNVSKDIDEIIATLGKNKDTGHIVIAAANYMYIYGYLRSVQELDKYCAFVRRVTAMERPIIGILNIPPPLEPDCYNLSKLDYKIVYALSKDPRRNLTDVAEELSVSVKTVRRRLEKMVIEKTIFLGLYDDHTASGDIIARFHLTYADGVEKDQVLSLLYNKYKKNVLNVLTFSNIPDFALTSPWFKNMHDLKTMESSLKKEGLFSSVMTNIYMDSYWFDTWKDDYLYEKAHSTD
jgi:DNA-binding Lrp family transcriptional regulator